LESLGPSESFCLQDSVTARHVSPAPGHTHRCFAFLIRLARPTRIGKQAARGQRAAGQAIVETPAIRRRRRPTPPLVPAPGPPRTREYVAQLLSFPLCCPIRPIPWLNCHLSNHFGHGLSCRRLASPRERPNQTREGTRMHAAAAARDVGPGCATVGGIGGRWAGKPERPYASAMAAVQDAVMHCRGVGIRNRRAMYAM
jgi:hypothetical protein